jgi:hypothetical protein
MFLPPAELRTLRLRQRLAGRTTLYDGMLQVDICTYIYVYICMYVYMYVYLLSKLFSNSLCDITTYMCFFALYAYVCW